MLVSGFLKSKLLWRGKRWLVPGLVSYSRQIRLLSAELAH